MRASGILMPVFSLPSRYGIGSFSKSAYQFVDMLKKAGQKYWQILPLCPTSYGDSPYQSFSTYAGNPYFIDLDQLIEEKLLTRKECQACDFGDDPQDIDYGKLYENRFKLLRKAYERANVGEDQEFEAYRRENAWWLDDYALFMAVKDRFDGVAWNEWAEDIRLRWSNAMDYYRRELYYEIEFYSYLQFVFMKQWKKLKNYANINGIEIIGDIPIYVALDSADVWQNASMFQLDEELNPKKVAGVPPDAFSESGQRWGNPLYDWKKIEADDFSWWRKRMEHSSKLYDVIRIDHFIGMVKYYAIPAEDNDARNGKWQKGPGLKLIKAINESIGNKKIIAEDLGVKIPEVVEVLEKSGYPGMKVLEFAFDGDRKNEHLPYNWIPNMVGYGGTHDNNTLMGYFSELEYWELGYIREYVESRHGSIEDLVDKIFKLAYESVANLVVFQMQDVLKIGNIGRMNLPSSMGTNWRWRMLKGQFGPQEIERLRYLCDIYGR